MNAIPVCRPLAPRSALARLSACLDSYWLGYGPGCRALEARFTAPRGGWALATSTCTSALYLAATLCRKASGDEAIVPAITFVSSAMTFLQAGFRIRIADVDPETLMLDLRAAERLLSPRTRALVVVHLYGQRFGVRLARDFCDAHGLTLIEDCAHRLDLLDPAGPRGDFTCYSFNAVKEAPAGEGGMLWGCDVGIEERARRLSNLGMEVDTPARSKTPVHRPYQFGPEAGLKLRLNDVAAALAMAGLDELPETRARRSTLFATYERELAELHPHVRLLSRRADDSFLMFVLRVSAELRETLRTELALREVATSVHYPSLAAHPLLGGAPCPEAEYASQGLLTLPCYPGLSDAEQEQVVTALRQSLPIAAAFK